MHNFRDLNPADLRLKDKQGEKNKGEKTMNVFTKHTQQQGVTYLEHFFFAVSIAIRLANSVIAFALHGIFPFIDIKKELDLEATARFITTKNNWIENKKQTGQTESVNQTVFQAR